MTEPTTRRRRRPRAITGIYLAGALVSLAIMIVVSVVHDRPAVAPLLAIWLPALVSDRMDAYMSDPRTPAAAAPVGGPQRLGRHAWLSLSFALISVGISTLFLYLRAGSETAPSALEGVLAASAVLLGSAIATTVVLWAKRKRRVAAAEPQARSAL